MKRKNKNTELTILSILAGIIYTLTIISSVIFSWEDVALSFIQGAEDTIDRKTELSDKETFTLTLKPKSTGKQYYGNTVINIKDGEAIPASYETINICYAFPNGLPFGVLVFRLIIIVFSIPLLFGVIYIPIWFYKLMKALYYENIFVRENVQRLRWIGALAIWMFIVSFSIKVFQYIIITQYIELGDYEIVFRGLGLGIILMGTILLIAASVLQRAITIKEDQELTI